MLRIIATYQLAAETGAAFRLELKGRLEGDWVDELRRTWRPLRAAIAEVPVSVAVSEVEFVDAAGKVLLAEMHRAGVDVARGEATVQPWCAFSGADHYMGAGSTMSGAVRRGSHCGRTSRAEDDTPPVES